MAIALPPNGYGGNGEWQIIVGIAVFVLVVGLTFWLTREREK